MNERERFININNATLQSLKLPELLAKDVKADILRLDKIHPVISGNKWFKLKFYLEEALEKQFNTIVTFGGAWSNHIVATAFASKLYNLNAIGIIRGERPLKLSQTLLNAEDYGMTLEFINRESYSEKNDDGFKQFYKEKFGRVYFIPEGGAGLPGIKGSEEILQLVDKNDYSHVLCCIGTGTMFSGLVNSSLPSQEVIGISVLKGVEFDTENTIAHGLKRSKIRYEYHFGGYAKKTKELIGSMNNFYLQTGIPTDFVYTGKLIFAFYDLIAKNYFSADSKVLVIHSGGLQGNASLPEGTLLF